MCWLKTESSVPWEIEHRLEEMGPTTVIDAAGGAVMPGLIDSHFHVVLGKYQPQTEGGRLHR